jgi:katanin p60 ATPase-containing subunit A1
MDDTHPVLRVVSEARSLGGDGEYDGALRAYASAKDLALHEAGACRARPELSRWNALIKDIVAEELQIRRIRSTVDEIIRELQHEDFRRGLQLEKNSSVSNSKPDFVTNVNSRVPRKQVQNSPKRRSCGPPRAAPQKDNPLMQQIIDDGILTRDPDVQWESIAGLSEIKRLLRQNLVILPMRPDIARGLLSPWKSVLLYGPPGTGKTFLAKAIATECRRCFFNVSASTIVSKFHGESEKLVSYLFDVAEEMAPSTIFFDEIDALAAHRGAQGELDASRRLKAQLLTKMEGIESSDKTFVLAATNFPWDLDEALLRRFQKRVYIPLPDADGRLELLRNNLWDIIDESFDIVRWSERLEGYSCADITNLCRDAAQIVFDRQMKALNTQQWKEMRVEEAQVIIRNRDFEVVVEKRKSSVDAGHIKKYEDWRRAKGAE